jgi:hypothetical protein
MDHVLYDKTNQSAPILTGDLQAEYFIEAQAVNRYMPEPGSDE